MVLINEDSTYISYMDNGKLDLWRVSKITHMAEKIKLEDNNGIRQIPDTLKHRVIPMSINYITEHLINEGFYEFEREGDLIKFNNYQKEGDVTIMHTKECAECKLSCIINVDESKCIMCRKR